MTWYCVRETWDDAGRLSARLVDQAESEEKPADEVFVEEDQDIYYTWYGSLQAAENAIAGTGRRKRGPGAATPGAKRKIPVNPL